MKFTIGLIAFACATSRVAAHGFITTVRVNGVEYPGWDINLDPYATPVVRFSPQYGMNCEHLQIYSLCVLFVGPQVTVGSFLTQRRPTLPARSGTDTCLLAEPSPSRPVEPSRSNGIPGLP